ncbi:hypothetical protein D8Y20_00020 [Mariprofundus sp. EBB-1]|uniref:hypothetical protein n=1 Tax=Mariprofundus sp. EBB-1 TaxID=2650971 RepID=UPI000EF1A084|nr:hypothetical protein [Mariprofundus sp. EBB-1]RLL55873.1 hypothetical protein D8Y20_00020 [Mariprofundus sp. EBB-1]
MRSQATTQIERLHEGEGRKPRILMIASAFVPLVNPEAIVNAKLALAFIEHGWHVDIVSRRMADITDYKYGERWEYPWESLRKHTFEVSYPHGGRLKRLIETLWGGVTLGYPILGCRWGLHAYQKAKALHGKVHYDLILSRSQPDAAHLPAMALSKETGTPWIANWNDPSKMPPPYGKGPCESLGFWHERFLKAVVKSASWITFPSERQGRYMNQYLGANFVNKSSMIPHVAFNQARNAGQIKADGFTIAYAGNITSERCPKSFLRGFKKFLGKVDNSEPIKFIFIGRDSTGEIENARNNGLEKNIELLGSLGYEMCQQNLEECNVLLIVEAPTEEGIFLPSKFIDYVQLGKPMLAVSPRESTVADYLHEYGGGIAADCKSSDEISNAIGALYQQWQNKSLYQKFNSARLEEAFSPKNIINQYELLIASMVKTHL